MKSRIQRLLVRDDVPLQPVVEGVPSGLVVDGAIAPTASFVAAITKQEPKPPQKPDELTWSDYLILLLQVAAEIEHGLMVQYLYAAYSLGHDEIPLDQQLTVRRWRRTIIAIAKEEMGHLLTVQNALRLVGGPVNLDREDFPWDSAFYPFPFSLERLSTDSLSCYVFAEKPPDVPNNPQYAEYKKHEEEIIATVNRIANGRAHPVDVLYERIITIVSDPDLIKESVFDANTYSMQASGDEWGKEYRPGTLQPDPLGAKEPANANEKHPASRFAANVIVRRMASRTEAAEALREIATQGEAPHLGSEDEPSHFDRFIEIYLELITVKDWSPTREVATNPSTIRGDSGSLIEWPASTHWADLFNIRYRMLLSYLAHTFRIPRATDNDKTDTRASVLERVFSEMYNLKTIAGFLVRMPLKNPPCPKRAGPPFDMPYSLALPEADRDCWELHQELLRASGEVCTLLRTCELPREGARYLAALCDLDGRSIAWIDVLLGGSGSTGSPLA